MRGNRIKRKIRKNMEIIHRLAPLALCSLLGCTTASPTSISLYHPRTKITRTCEIRDSGGGSLKYAEALSGAVEACAKQLEARGFVRVDRLPGEPRPADRGATIP
jgi:hypothetical protein